MRTQLNAELGPELKRPTAAAWISLLRAAGRRVRGTSPLVTKALGRRRSLLAYLLTYVRMYVLTYVRTYLCTYVPPYLLTYPLFLRRYVRTYLRSYALTCVLHTADLLTCLLTNLALAQALLLKGHGPRQLRV